MLYPKVTIRIKKKQKKKNIIISWLNYYKIESLLYELFVIVHIW